MTDRCCFLREDFEVLVRVTIGDTTKQIKNALEQTGASQDGGDCWHDSFDFEEGQRGATMWSTRLRELIAIKSRAEIVDPDPTGNRAYIGRTVTVADEDTGEITKYLIASFMVLKKRDGLKAISYMSPLAILIRGARVGETREGRIGEFTKKFKIIDIK